MKRILFITVIAAFILASCSSNAASAPAPIVEQYRSAREIVVPSAIGGGASVDAANSMPLAADAASQAAAVDRLVIQNADLSIVVADVDAKMKAVEDLATSLGGYVVSSQKYQTQVMASGKYVDVPQATVTIRVPAEKLDGALSEIKKDVVEVQSESRSGQDVTADYIDLQSRLKNLEATEAQLTKIMESATATEDVMNVFNQLTSIREQIEQVKGQIKYYQESAALSAISMTIVAEETIQPIEIAGWKPQGVAHDAIQDLVYFFQGFVDWLIRFVLYTLPALVLVGIPLFLVFLGVRAIFRKFRKPKVKPMQAVEPKQ